MPALRNSVLSYPMDRVGVTYFPALYGGEAYAHTLRQVFMSPAYLLAQFPDLGRQLHNITPYSLCYIALYILIHLQEENQCDVCMFFLIMELLSK